MTNEMTGIFGFEFEKEREKFKKMNKINDFFPRRGNKRCGHIDAR